MKLPPRKEKTDVGERLLDNVSLFVQLCFFSSSTTLTTLLILKTPISSLLTRSLTPWSHRRLLSYWIADPPPFHIFSNIMDNEIFWISFCLIWLICAHIGSAMHTGHRHYGSVNWLSVSTLQFGMKIFTLSIPVWQSYVKKFGLLLSSWQMYWRAEKLYNMCWNWGQPQPTANTVSAPNKGKKRTEKKRKKHPFTILFHLSEYHV